MLAAGAVLHLPSGSTAATSTTMSSQLYGAHLWTCPAPSSDASSANSGMIQPTGGGGGAEIKPISLSAGEYLVSHVVNGKPVLPLATSAVDQLVAPVPSHAVSDYKVTRNACQSLAYSPLGAVVSPHSEC